MTLGDDADLFGKRFRRKEELTIVDGRLKQVRLRSERSFDGEAFAAGALVWFDERGRVTREAVELEASAQERRARAKQRTYESCRAGCAPLSSALYASCLNHCEADR